MSSELKTFVDFIIPTYNRYDQINCLLYSLISQYDPDWSAQVIIDDKENDKLINTIISINDKRISYLLTGTRYNNWGHTPREIGKQRSYSRYIIMTGDDNYYVPVLVSELKKVAENNNTPPVIYWDMIHNYWDYSGRPSLLCEGSIDMGAFATRRDLAQQIKLPTTYCADAEFIELLKDTLKKQQGEDAYDEAKNFVHIQKTLYIHN
jgi:hypothetical protein